MATTSTRSIRIRGVAADTTIASFQESLSTIRSTTSEKKSIFSWASPAPPSSSRTKLDHSLADQNDYKTATVTFTNEDAKNRAIQEEYPEEWVIDDIFNGVTVLYSPETRDDKEVAEIDICAVHGLQGNGFDTWASKPTTRRPTPAMWLRDFLPYIPLFKRSRIMAFGYSSQLRDKSNVSGISDWADDLLTQVGWVRRTENERSRPMIFVCHSLGGIVAREAMIRVNSHPEKYDGIRIEQCGLLFLGVPHSGTDQADWNDFVSGIASAFGIRTEIVETLRSFNGFGVESKEAFKSIPRQPPYFCLCETRRIDIAPSQSRLVVTKDSAGLNGVVAFPVPDSDHKEICRFHSKFQPRFELVIDRLTRLREELLQEERQAKDINLEELPGHPPLTAERYPLPLGKSYYEGQGLISERNIRLIGRVSDYKSLNKALSGMIKDQKNDSAIAISGMGGIGKTELLLTVASRWRDKCHVFLLKCQDLDSLRHAYLSIASSIGPDLLSQRYPDQDLYNVWSSLDDEEKMDSFKQWLSDRKFENTILMFDDLDALKASNISLTLPPQARNIVITTRNPLLVVTLAHEYRLLFRHMTMSELKDPEIKAIMARILQIFEDEDEKERHTYDTQLEVISDIVNGHPLIASSVAFFVMTNFTEQYGQEALSHFVDHLASANPHRGLPFALFNYKPPLKMSIAESFEISRMRLPQPNGPSWRLMQLMAFITPGNMGYAKFIFYERDWIFEIQETLHFNDIWCADQADLQSWLSNIRQVSFGTPDPKNKQLRFHPLLVQYLQEMAGEEDRRHYIRDIIVVADQSAIRSEARTRGLLDFLSAQVSYCLKICNAYGISLSSLELSRDVYLKCKNQIKI